jgi:hypothetical protein
VETITASGGTISSGIRGGGKEFEGGMSVEDDPYQDDAISERIFRHMSLAVLFGNAAWRSGSGHVFSNIHVYLCIIKIH